MELTFDLAEEIAELGGAPSDVITDLLPKLTISQLGPLVQLAMARPQLAARVQDQRAKAILAALTSAPTSDSSVEPRDWEVFPVPRYGLDTNDYWQAFVWRLKRSAAESQVPAQHAGGLAHAVIELADNVVAHSESRLPGVAYYAASAKEFEFGIIDTGIGMLESLRRNPSYRILRDDLEALRLGIQDGVSRFAEPGHGFGYREILRAIRKCGAVVHVRSGTGLLTLRPSDQHPYAGTTSHRGGTYSGLMVAVSLNTKS